MLARCALGLLLVLICSPAGADVRSWTDRQGNTMRAEFVRVHEGRVVLKSGTQTKQVPLANLSQQDQDYVASQLNRKATRSGDDEGGQPVRIWTDTKGNQVAASFVRMNDTQAMLAENGKPRPIGFAELSDRDQEHIKELLRSQGQEQQVSALEQHVEQAKAAAAAAAAQQAGSAASPPSIPSPSSNPFQERMQQEAEARQQRADEQRQRDEQRRAEEQERRRQQQEAADQQRAEFARQQEEHRQRMQEMQQQSQTPISRFIPTPPTSSFETTTVTEYRCSKCNKVVPENISAGGTCPHCGVYFDYTESPTGQRQYANSSSSGSSSSSYRISGRSVRGLVFLVILVGSAVAGLWKKFGGG